MDRAYLNFERIYCINLCGSSFALSTKLNTNFVDLDLIWLIVVSVKFVISS